MSKKEVKKEEKREATINIVRDEKEPIVVLTSSEQKKRFKALIEAYKEQNPDKYAKKKDALEAKLNSL